MKPGSLAVARKATAGKSTENLLATRANPTPRRFALAWWVLPAFVPTLLVIWIVLVAGQSVRLAFDVVVGQRLVYMWPDIATWQGLLGAALVYVACLMAAVLTQWRRPGAVLPVTVATGACVLIAGALATGAAGALVFVVTSALLSWLIGWLLLHPLPHPSVPPLARSPLALALGLGVLGLLFFILGSVGTLTAPAVLGVTGAVTLALLAVQRPHLELLRFRSWRGLRFSWFEAIVVGITVGAISFAMLIALVPETISDPVWQHMPIAREIWQTGSIREFAHLEVSRDPMQAHVLYAVAYGLGGLASIKLMHALVGLGAICGVAALGWLLGGRSAAVLSTAVFASMPLTLWLLGHALIDFFTVLFSMTALTCLVLWQRTEDLRWPLVAGVLSGVGLTAKLNMLPLIAVLGAALFLTGRQPGQWRARLPACVVFGLGTAVALPWVLRSVLAQGTLSPKIQVVINSLTGRFVGSGETTVPASLIPVETALQVYDPQAFALGQSPLALLRIPWFFTFHADEHRFLVIGRGEIGILLLMLLPLIIFIPRNRSSALIGLAALFSYIAWAFSPFQIIRHLLPTFALVAVLVGTAVGSTLDDRRSQVQQLMRGVIRGGLLLGLVVAPVFLLHGVLTQVPVNFLLGRESAAAYVERAVPAAVALEASSALPPDTLVAYFGRRDGGAQIYSEARLVYVEPNNTLASLGSSPAEVLDSLNELGVQHFIWNRSATSPDAWRATVLSLPFLRDHTRILAGDRNAYLFEITQASRAHWNDQQRWNHLGDPDLRKVKRGTGPWQKFGDVGGNRGSPAISAEGLIAQRVSVSGGQAYLLEVDAKCPEPDDSVNLALRWFDRDDQELGKVSEEVVPGTAGSEQFLWNRAPDAATSVSVELTASRWSKSCDFDSAMLFAQP